MHFRLDWNLICVHLRGQKIPRSLRPDDDDDGSDGVMGAELVRSLACNGSICA